jgi:hypothetical protein
VRMIRDWQTTRTQVKAGASATPVRTHLLRRLWSSLRARTQASDRAPSERLRNARLSRAPCRYFTISGGSGSGQQHDQHA